MTTRSYALMQKRAVYNLGFDPFSWYKQMRMTSPASIDEEEQLVELFRYQDVHAVFANPGQYERIQRDPVLSEVTPANKKLLPLLCCIELVQ